MRFRPHRFAAAALLTFAPLLVAATSTSPAFAGGEDRALALDLFQQGRTLEAAHDYAAALAKFEAAANMMRTFGILLNIAECQENLGQTASAWATWREAEAIASDGQKTDDEAMARDREKALEPKLVRLTLVVPPDADAPDLEIRRDGISVPRAAWGSAIPVDPGTHSLEARASDRKPRSMQVVVPASGTGPTVTLAPLEAEARLAAKTAPETASGPLPAVATSLPSTPAPVRADHETGSGQRIAGWVLGGVGVAAAAAGIAVAVVGQSQHDQAQTTASTGNQSLAESQNSTAGTTKEVGLAVIGGGGALVVTAVILLLTAPSSGPSPSASVSFAPWVAANAGGGSFCSTW